VLAPLANTPIPLRTAKSGEIRAQHGICLKGMVLEGTPDGEYVLERVFTTAGELTVATQLVKVDKEIVFFDLNNFGDEDI